MKFIPCSVAPLVTALSLLVVPLSIHAVPVEQMFTQAQLNSAVAEVRQALKTMGVPSIKAATRRQLAAAVASVIAKHRRSKYYIALLTEALIEARPEMSGELIQVVLESLTPPGGTPSADLVAVVVNAAAAENATLLAGGYGGAPSGVTITNTNTGATSNSSASTINPSNISGSGSTSPVTNTNSPETVTGP